MTSTLHSSWKCLVGLLSLVLLSACASHANYKQSIAKVDYQKYAEPAVPTMRYINLYGWQEIDDQRLIIQTTPKKAYLLTLFYPCFDLDWQLSIGLSSFSRTVSAGFDHVLAGNQRCRIKTIQPIDLKQVQNARKLAIAQNREGKTR